MRDSDLNDNKSEVPEMAIIRRMRSPRRINAETAEAIFFDVAAFKLDRKLGVAEHVAVERNLKVVIKWPDLLF